MGDVLNNKDSTSRLEIVRFLADTDPDFYKVLNRPHSDIEQRTKDLDRIFTPARGLRVRQTLTASDDVEVEVGFYIDADGVTIDRSNSGSTQTLTIPPASAGKIRADLVYFNMATGLAARVAGSEVAAGGGFNTGLWPDLPAGLAGAVPLAILYVDETPTPFSELVVTNAAGRIIDVRPASGAGRPLYYTSAGLADVVGGAVGTSPAVSRGDHQHALNISDGAPPETLSANTVANPGEDDFYARRDHEHPLSIETNASNIQKDGTASVGSSPNLVRSNHVHPLNVDGTNPANISETAASTGSAGTYARRDHVHLLPANLVKSVSYVYNSVTAFSGSITVITGVWLIFVWARHHQTSWDNVDLVIDGTTVDSSGNFGDQDGTGYVMVFGGKQVSGPGTFNFSMTNTAGSVVGSGRMTAVALKVG